MLGPIRISDAKKLATAFAFGGPRSSCIRHGAHCALRQGAPKMT